MVEEAVVMEAVEALLAVVEEAEEELLCLLVAAEEVIFPFVNPFYTIKCSNRWRSGTVQYCGGGSDFSGGGDRL